MIKLDKIKINSICYPNIFLTKSKEVEIIDIVLDIDYEIDDKTVNLSKYNIKEKDLEEKTIEDIFDCYMIIPLEFDTYKNLDKISYNELEYLILSEVTSDLEYSNQFISNEEKEKAFNLIKACIQSNEFKKELENTINNNKKII